MSETITIQDAQAHLTEVIADLVPGEEMLITQNGKPVAKLIAQGDQPRQARQPGSAKGKLTIHSEENDYLEDFKEYMP